MPLRQMSNDVTHCQQLPTVQAEEGGGRSKCTQLMTLLLKSEYILLVNVLDNNNNIKRDHPANFHFSQYL